MPPITVKPASRGPRELALQHAARRDLDRLLVLSRRSQSTSAVFGSQAARRSVAKSGTQWKSP